MRASVLKNAAVSIITIAVLAPGLQARQAQSAIVPTGTKPTPASQDDRRPSVTGKNLIYSTGLNVADIDRALKFFTEGLGMKERSRFSPTPGTVEVWVGYGNSGESAIMLVYSKTRTGPVLVGDWGRVVLYVKDVRAMADNVAKGGVGKVLRGPSAQPANKVTTANVEDPDGHRFELVEFN